MACLRAGDDQSALECLERLVRRFGTNNERIMALKGLGKEATAENDEALKKVLEEYQEILDENAANVPIAKRKVALLRSMGREGEAIQALTTLLDISPVDSEAWSELADLYLSQGLYAQAVHALEEVLILVPNAWNFQARLGEVLLMAASANSDSQQKYLAESVKRFCRSVELCEDYLRGYYGLKKVTDQILKDTDKAKKGKTDPEVFQMPEQKTIERLNQAATDKLAEIVRRNTAGEPGWQGYKKDEVDAAKELIAKSTAEIER